MPTAPCPCGGSTLAACCGPLLANREQADTPERLMRSRYTAFALGDADHLFRTWHPRTRPRDTTPEPGVRWTGLRILQAGGEEVEFEADYADARGRGTLHERSRFARRAGRWFYLDAV